MTDSELLAAALVRIADLTAQVETLTARLLESEHRAEVAEGVAAMLVDSERVTLAMHITAGAGESDCAAE